MAEQGQAIGVNGQRQAMKGEGTAEVLKMVPGGVGGDEDRVQEFAGMIIDSQQESLFVLPGPPLVDGGIVLPELPQSGAFPPPPGFGCGRGRIDQQGEVTAGVSGDRFTVPLKSKTGCQFVGHELVVGRSSSLHFSILFLRESPVHFFQYRSQMFAMGRLMTIRISTLHPFGVLFNEATRPENFRDLLLVSLADLGIVRIGMGSLMKRKVLQILRQTTFTPFELTVLIGISAVLAAPILPVVGRSKGTALKAGCRSIHRQVILVWQMYADNLGGRLASIVIGNHGIQYPT